MAQSVSSSSSNRNIGRDDSSDENSRPFGAHGDSGGNVYTGYSPDRTNGMPTISSTSTTSSALGRVDIHFNDSTDAATMTNDSKRETSLS
jgi:hypothetical protein